MKRVITFMIFFVLFFLQYSQAFAMERSFQSLGVSASSYSGSGLSYRYHFDNNWGFQLTGGAIIRDEDKNVAVGIEFQSDLTSVSDKRLFLILSTGWYMDTETYFRDRYTYAEINEDVSYYKIAVGFGGELAFGEGIVNHLTLGIAIFPIGLAIKEKHSYYGYDDTSQVSFGASIFTHFNF